MTNHLYDYWPIVDRPPVVWPDGRGLAFYVGVSVERFELGKPSTSIGTLTNQLAYDPLNAGWRDYGARVGIWRLCELFDRHGLRASVFINSDVPAIYPEIVHAGNERGWCWVAHGRNNSSLWTGMTPDEEREALSTVVDELTRATGTAPKGWLGPALTETEQTPLLLAERGFTYLLDWCADDQPFPLNVPGERIVAVPYTVEINDIPFFLNIGGTAEDFGRAIVDQFDVLHEESGRRPGAVMSVSLHPFLAGQPFRSAHLDRALEYVRRHDDVWFTTSDDIAAWYLEHHFDEAVFELAKRSSVRPG